MTAHRIMERRPTFADQSMAERKNEHSANSGIPTSVFCPVCYFMAALAVAFELLPADAFAIFGGKPEGETLPISLAFAGIFFPIGVMMHIVLYRRDPEKFDVAMFRSVGLAMATVLACLFGLSIILSRATGLAPEALTQRFDTAVSWIGVAFVVVVPIFIAVLLASLYISLRLYPGNRILRRIAIGDFAGAIRIGESYPPEKRDFTTNLNLAVAYALSKDAVKAKRLLAELEKTAAVPVHYTQESFEQALSGLRDAIEQAERETTGTSSAAC